MPALTAKDKGDPDGDCVLYWMDRDQRCADNWALLYAQDLADRLGSDIPLRVAFCLPRCKLWWS